MWMESECGGRKVEVDSNDPFSMSDRHCVHPPYLRLLGRLEGFNTTILSGDVCTELLRFHEHRPEAVVDPLSEIFIKRWRSGQKKGGPC